MTHPEADLIQTLRGAARPLTGASHDYDELLERIGGARFVLIGEASHGTHEFCTHDFYRERARLTRRLIGERGFTAVAVEADWPDASRVNRSVRGRGDFARFPRWMWRNEDLRAFAEWLRGHNETRPGESAGFSGLDLHSLHRFMRAVVEDLGRVDPGAARRARARSIPVRATCTAPSCTSTGHERPHAARRHPRRGGGRARWRAPFPPGSRPTGMPSSGHPPHGWGSVAGRRGPLLPTGSPTQRAECGPTVLPSVSRAPEKAVPATPLPPGVRGPSVPNARPWRKVSRY